MSTSALALGGLFGIRIPVCPPGSTHEPKSHRCFYCPDGSEPMKTTTSSTGFKCLGIPLLGKKCNMGEDHFYDIKTNICMLCESGYTFYLNRELCYQD